MAQTQHRLPRVPIDRPELLPLDNAFNPSEGVRLQGSIRLIRLIRTCLSDFMGRDFRIGETMRPDHHMT
ncbi:hypothetical protein Enr13x_69310 [Stieleria neptunia]|uniref:Uncharacterized protein n=1 Tax=Stieleria neptunia TaxID=2527979 RepID=A0A518I1M8_9BACT|nr:hypothetical protein Enr13x_69310 [Stieleria neptunia]